MSSVWEDSIQKPPQFERLQESIKTDVLIIGGGISGILCAHMLKNAGVDCVLVEAKNICNGITKNTTAKITFQHGLIYDDLINKLGKDKARLYLEANAKAIEEYVRLSKDIQCDLEKKNSYVYSMNNRKKIEKETAALNALGVKAEFMASVNLPINIAGAVRVENQAQFNPLKFAFAISKNLPIYENTKVLELKPNRAVTEHGEVRCEKIIVATHFPTLNKHGGYFIKMYQHRSYVTALEGAQNVNGMYVDEDAKGLSFRNYGNLLLLGGGSHRTGKNGGAWRELEEFAKVHYPSSKTTNRWATQDCMTLDGIPYIGKYSKNTPDLYVATGFNKWGMTSAMASAMILTDLVRDKSNKYAPVFSPSRTMSKAPLAANAFESVIGLLTPTTPRCPHLGCALKYNRDEHTWDCPCHGSRFEKNGKLIDNPATDDKNSI